MIKQSVKLYAFFIFFSPTFLLGIPRYALQNSSSCILCHVNPSGGGLRNDYGILYGMDDLTAKVPQKFSSYSGIILNHIQIGGDVRIQSVSKNKGDLPDGLAIFPMQANIQMKTNVKQLTILADLATLQSDLGVQFLYNLKDNYIRVGSSKPSFGLRLEDHTVFTRGGNIKLVKGNNREGMPFTPRLKNAPIAEIGRFHGNAHLTVGITKGYFSNESETIFGKAEHYGSLGIMNRLIGISYLKQIHSKNGLEMINLFGGLSSGKLSWMGEMTVAENLVLGQSFATYSELTYQMKRGLNISGRIDFFDESISFTQDAIRRTTIGLNYVPLPFLDIKFQIRSAKLFSDVESKGIELLTQLHVWF